MSRATQFSVDFRSKPSPAWEKHPVLETAREQIQGRAQAARCRREHAFDRMWSSYLRCVLASRAEAIALAILPRGIRRWRQHRSREEFDDDIPF